MKKNTHIAYGFITALASIIIYVVLYISGLAFKPWAQWVSYCIFLIGIMLNAMAFSKANDNDVTFGNVFSSCFKACAVVTLVILGWSFISLWIFPDMVDKGMEIARQKMEEKGSLSEEQINQGLEMTHKYFKLFMVMGVVFGYMFFGAIFSLFGAAIAKKKPKAKTV